MYNVIFINDRGVPGCLYGPYYGYGEAEAVLKAIMAKNDIVLTEEDDGYYELPTGDTVYIVMSEDYTAQTEQNND